jgi:hypothetical protein
VEKFFVQTSFAEMGFGMVFPLPRYC